MKLQTKKILISLASVFTIVVGSLAGVMIYGSTSDDAKGFTIEQDDSRNFAFDSFDAVMIDNSGVQDKIIGNYDRNSDSVGGIKVKEFIKNYKQNHSNASPLFKIKTKLFQFDNRYLAAVSPKDWYDFVIWYIGVTVKNPDGTTTNIPGHLSFGPEAGSVSTFEIVSGVERKGSSITLGGRSMTNKEIGKITFYPDAFFGGIQLYSLYTGQFNNRILSPGNNPSGQGINAIPMTLNEVKPYLEALNAINKHNKEKELEISRTEHHIKYPQPILDKYGDKIGQIFGNQWGTHSIHEFKPYYLEKSSIRTNPDGTKEQLYNVYNELIPWVKDDTPNIRDDNPSLIEKVAQTFPQLTTHIDNGAHFVRNPDGSFKLEETGSFNIILPSENIGLPQILASINSNYEGVGIDFLKYVSVHEYGHHLTLMMAQDISEGGVIVGDIHNRAKPNMDGLYNIDILNNYLKSRAPHLRAFNVDPLGEFMSGDNTKLNSQFFAFKVCDGNWSEDNLQCSITNGSSGIITPITLEKISGHRDSNGNIIEPKPTDNPHYKYGYLGYKQSLNDLKDSLNYIAPGLTLSEAVLINSFDNISGTMNPGFDFKFIAQPTTTSYLKPVNIDLYHSYVANSEITSKYSNFLYPEASIQELLNKYQGIDTPPATLITLPGIIQLILIFEKFNITPTQLVFEKTAQIRAYLEKKYDELHDGEVINQQEKEKFINHEAGDMEWKMRSLFSKNAISSVLTPWNEDNIAVIFNTAHSNNPGDIHNFIPSIIKVIQDIKNKIPKILPENMSTLKPSDINNVIYITLEHALKFLGWESGETTTGSHEMISSLYEDSRVIAQPQPELSLYDVTSKSWITAYDSVLNLKDKNNELIFSPTQDQPTDLNNIDTNNYFSIPITDYLNDPTITKEWLKFSDYFKTLSQEKQEIIKNSLKQYLAQLKEIIVKWTAPGFTFDEIHDAKTNGVTRPQETDLRHPNYLYSYAEVMTRDFVQITYGYSDNESPLSNGPEGLNIYESESSFEYYISSSLTSDIQMNNKYVNSLSKWFTMQSSWFATGTISASKLSAVEIKDLSPEAKEWYDKISSPDSSYTGLIWDQGIDNSYLGVTRFLSNGYEQDRKMREILETTSGNTWGLYTGTTSKSEGEFGAIDYWNFIKNSYGVSDRALSGLFRDKQSDKVYMYGYISNKDAEQVKWLAFKNTSNGKVSYVPVHKGSEVSNLFYLETQGDLSSQHSISDDGYTAWATEKFSSGLFVGETISEGSYEVYFVDQNHQKINLFKADPTTPTNNSNTPLTFLSNRNYIAENGKIFSSSPTLFEKKTNGSEIYIVNRRFNA